MTRYFLAAAAVAGMFVTAAPAHANVLCVIVHRTHEQSTSICGPYGSPLPHVDCVYNSTVVDVCELR